MNSSVNAPDPGRIFLPGFEAAGAAYMVTGGVGAIAYGEPRMTNDIDIVIVLRPAMAGSFAAQFADATFYVPPVEAIREEAAREHHGHFNLIHLDSLLRADVYLAGQDPLQAWGLADRRRTVLGGVESWVAPPEYVILQKLIYYRDGKSDRHLRDIAWMLRVSAELINLPLLEAKVREVAVEAELALARETRLDA